VKATVPVGIGPPNALFVQVASADGGLDLTTVTSATLQVRRPDGTTASWPAALVAGATALTLTVERIFAVTDCPTTGEYAIAPVLAVPGGTVPAYAVRLFVAPPYDVESAPGTGLTLSTTVVQ
jgi:hypothetical protein